VRKSGRQTTYGTVFLSFGATGEFPKGYPPPGCFGKRGCKLLKTKDRSRRKKVKRLQAIDKARVRGGAAGGVREVSSR
jgi:hypothetical protein